MEEKTITRVEKALAHWAAFVDRRAVFVLLVFGLAAALCLAPAGKLRIVRSEDIFTSQTAEDPEKRKAIYSRIGGADFLVGVIEGGKQKDRKNFVDAWAQRLEAERDKRIEKRQNGMLSFTLYRLPMSFFEDRRLLYLKEKDLLDIEERLERRLEQERKKKNPFYVNLLDEEEPEVDISFADLQEKYGVKRFREYSTSDDGEIVAILFKPTLPSDEAEFSIDFIRWVRDAGEALLKTRAYPDVDFSMGGTYDEHFFKPVSLFTGIFPSILFVIGCFSFLIIFVFRRIRPLVMVLAATFVGSIYLAALAFWLYGEINLFVVLALPCAAGLGISHGSLLLYRYIRERRKNRSVEEALGLAILKDGRIILLGGLGAASAMLCLISVGATGLTRFGVLCGLGILIMLVVQLCLLPAILTISEHYYMMVVRSSITISHPMPSRFPQRQMVFWFGVILVVVAIVLIFQSWHCWGKPWCSTRERCCEDGPCCRPFMEFEYNFNRLARPAPRSSEIRRKFNIAAHLPLKPLIVVSPNREAMLRFSDDIEKSVKYGDIVQTVSSIYTFLPRRQKEKKLIMNRIDRLATEENVEFLDSNVKRRIDDVRPILHPEPVVLYQLPLSVIRTFTQQPEGTEGCLQLLKEAFSNRSDSLSDEDWNQVLLQSLSRIEASRVDSFLNRLAASGLNDYSKSEIQGFDYAEKRDRLAKILHRFHTDYVGTLAYIYLKEDPLYSRAALKLKKAMKEWNENHPGISVMGQGVDIAETMLRFLRTWRNFLIFSLGAGVLLLLLTIRRPLTGLSVIIQPILALFALTVGMAAFDIRWNLYSWAALPILLGISFELGLRTFVYYWDEKQIGSMQALANAWPSIALTTLTITFALLSVIFIEHKGIASIGRLAFAGVLVGAAISLTVFPVILELIHTKTRKW